jgi:GntR family transcriptional repressor for pyruvate dehydrogenase complex
MIREALSGLQLAGIVERRPGLGTVIARIPNTAMDLEEHLAAGTSMTQVIEARLALELGVVHLLCDGKEYDLRDVVGLLDAMRIGIREDKSAEAYIRPSLEFHLALARATERPMVASCQESLLRAMEPHVWLLLERYSLSLAERSLALHQRMLQAIQARDVIVALAEVKAHYSPYPVTTISSAARAGA